MAWTKVLHNSNHDSVNVSQSHPMKRWDFCARKSEHAENTVTKKETFSHMCTLPNVKLLTSPVQKRVVHSWPGILVAERWQRHERLDGLCKVTKMTKQNKNDKTEQKGEDSTTNLCLTWLVILVPPNDHQFSAKIVPGPSKTSICCTQKRSSLACFFVLPVRQSRNMYRITHERS